jgi:hypothetical protein
VFTTSNALTFLNFNDDSLTNRDLFIELRNNALFMFFEFMISIFVHEFLLREFVMLMFSAICINVENDSRNVFDFKFATIFLFSKRSFCIREKTFSILWTLWRRTWKLRESSAIFLRDTVLFWYGASGRFSSFLLFSLCYNSIEYNKIAFKLTRYFIYLDYFIYFI